MLAKLRVVVVDQILEEIETFEGKTVLRYNSVGKTDFIMTSHGYTGIE